MDTKEYDFSRIIDINNNGLTYLDDLGDKCFIDFCDCRRNWINHINSSNEYNINNLNEKDTKCVGDRDICAIPKYFEFYSSPKVRFIFKDKDSFIARLFNFKSISHKHFIKVQYSIKDAGWFTYDLS